MLRIGITGGIGCGKSTGIAFVQQSGFVAIDADQLSREAVACGSEGLGEVVEAFGPNVLLSDGSLDRVALAARVFSNPEELEILEGILHPRIHRAWQSQFGVWAMEGRLSGCVVIPLLFEKGYQDFFDLVIAVGCSDATQMARLLSRGWEEVGIRGRIASQWSTARKMELADRVIWTEGSMETHIDQWRRLFPCMKGEE